MQKTTFLALGLLIGAPLGAHAQETLGSVGAASAIGATMGAAAGSSITGSSATRNVGRATTDLIDDASGAGAPTGGGRSTVASTSTLTQSSSALNWGTGNADTILNQLLATGGRPQPIPDPAHRSARGQAAYSRRVKRMTAAQRKKLVLQKYQVPPINYLGHYLPEDRYKITSGMWKFLSTETDRFYYRADAPGMLRQSPNRVIGFYTWQDAMIAGYRPDPLTQPTPGREFATLARIGRGPQLRNFVEYAYAGQMTAANFAVTWNYIQRVIAAVQPPRDYARPLLPQTIETILEASLTGNPGLIPTQIGGQPREVEVAASARDLVGANGAIPAGGRGPTSGSGSMIEGGGEDKRADDFEKFSNRAGKLAASGSERNRDLNKH